MSDRYGCFNRAPYAASYPGHDGQVITRASGETEVIPKTVQIPSFGQKDCQFTLTNLGRTDARCAGCSWKKDLS